MIGEKRTCSAQTADELLQWALVREDLVKPLCVAAHAREPQGPYVQVRDCRLVHRSPCRMGHLGGERIGEQRPLVLVRGWSVRSDWSGPPELVEPVTGGFDGGPIDPEFNLVRPSCSMHCGRRLTGA